MSAALKTTLMLLGAGVVLLLAGAMPVGGVPEVYHGGLMRALGLLVALACLWGTCRLARGKALRLCAALPCALLTAAALVAAGEADDSQTWLAAACLAAACAAGYAALRLMTPRLWLAALHVCIAALLGGVYADYYGKVSGAVTLPADGRTTAQAMTPQDGGEPVPLGFTLRVDSFDVSYYDTTAYTVYEMGSGGFRSLGKPELHGDRLVLGQESWPLAELKSAPGMPRPYLLLPGEPPRIIMQDTPTVRDYAAACTLQQPGAAPLHRTLRVNKPLSCGGWQVSLMNHSAGRGDTRLLMMASRAPGRLPVLVSLVGIIICTACWCWARKPEQEVRA